MKASELDKKSAMKMPTSREWLGVVGAAIAVVLIFALWTFWT